MTGNNDIKFILQPRDATLLQHLSIMRVADREQVKQVAGFGSTTRANARLLILTRAGLLKRFFVGTSVGTKKSVYALTAKGAAIAKTPFKRLRIRGEEVIGADLQLDHRLRINSIYLEVLKSKRLVRWLSFEQTISPAIKLIPDAYLEISGDVPKPMFLEVDLGTETSRVWRAKTSEYLKFALTGTFQKRFQLQQFRVLVIATTERRLQTILKTISQQTEKIFWGTTFDVINRDGFWNPIWLRPKGDQKHSLL